MGRKIIRPKDRQEWLQLRGFGIGSSEVATILGVNPWETPLQLWRHKKGIDPPKEENFAMKAGHYLEDAVSQFFADETGAQIIKSSAGDWLIVDTDKEYLRVSPDRTFWLPDTVHNDANKGILECKTTQMEIDADYLPQHWYCQLQYQLHVAGYTHGALAWLTSGRQFGYKSIKYDHEFCEWMVSEIDRFWEENIIGNVEPAPVNAEDILIKSPRHTIGKTIEATADTINTLSALKALKEEIKNNEREAKSIEDTLKIAMNDAEAIMSHGKPLATWRVAKDGEKFDAAAFKAENPELYQKYVKPIMGNRRFLIK